MQSHPHVSLFLHIQIHDVIVMFMRRHFHPLKKKYNQEQVYVYKSEFKLVANKAPSVLRSKTFDKNFKVKISPSKSPSPRLN